VLCCVVFWYDRNVSEGNAASIFSSLHPENESIMVVSYDYSVFGVTTFDFSEPLVSIPEERHVFQKHCVQKERFTHTSSPIRAIIALNECKESLRPSRKMYTKQN
jgi:hypothetical protein